MKRSKPFFARKTETVEAMVPYDDPDDVFGGSPRDVTGAGAPTA